MITVPGFLIPNMEWHVKFMAGHKYVSSTDDYQ